MSQEHEAQLRILMALDSPIEARFLEALFSESPCSIQISDAQKPRTVLVSRPSYGRLDVAMQEKVGPYRADFVLRFSESDAAVFVECDGHDFHERTAAQAEHDRSRDRYFASQSLTVLRFTGREIHRSASAVARAALQQLFQLVAGAKLRNEEMCDRLREIGCLGHAERVGLIRERATGDGFEPAPEGAEPSMRGAR